MRGIFSLQKSLGNTEDFTLEDILASPELPPDDAEFKRNGKPHGRQISLDAETVKTLRDRFGDIPLGRAIRSLVGLPPLEKQDAWQDWEDNIMRECYSWGGSMAVIAQGVARNRDCVIQRAQVLGLRRSTFKPNSAWLTLSEVADIFHCHLTLVHRWCKLGYINTIRLRAPIKRFIFFEKASVIEFIKKHPFVYPHEKITNGYRQYLPDILNEWLNVDQASEIFHYSKTGIKNHIYRGHVPVIRGFGRRCYINLKHLREYLDSPPLRVKKTKPSAWKVVKHGDVKHFVIPDEDGCLYMICRKDSKPVYNPVWKKSVGYKLRYARGNPTCKNCLRIWASRGGAVEARRVDTPEVVGSNPTPATNLGLRTGCTPLGNLNRK